MQCKYKIRNINKMFFYLRQQNNVTLEKILPSVYKCNFTLIHELKANTVFVFAKSGLYLLNLKKDI